MLLQGQAGQCILCGCLVSQSQLWVRAVARGGLTVLQVYSYTARQPACRPAMWYKVIGHIVERNTIVTATGSCLHGVAALCPCEKLRRFGPTARGYDLKSIQRQLSPSDPTGFGTTPGCTKTPHSVCASTCARGTYAGGTLRVAGLGVLPHMDDGMVNPQWGRLSRWWCATQVLTALPLCLPCPASTGGWQWAPRVASPWSRLRGRSQKGVAGRGLADLVAGR